MVGCCVCWFWWMILLRSCSVVLSWCMSSRCVVVLSVMCRSLISCCVNVLRCWMCWFMRCVSCLIMLVWFCRVLWLVWLVVGSVRFRSG